MIILDTCALLWLAQGGARISIGTLKAIEDEPIVAVSTVSAFEIRLKQQSGTLTLTISAEQWWARAIDHHRLEVIDLDPLLLIRSTRLPPIHHDFADRFIIAAALMQKAPVVTADTLFGAYGVDVMM